MAGWGNVGRQVANAAVKAPTKVAQKTSWGDVGRSSGLNAAAGAVGGSGPNPETMTIMRQSGSSDPNDPYNWAGIARALEAQAAMGGAVQGAATANTAGDGGGGGYSNSGGGGSGSSYTAPPPAVVQSPSTFETPAQVQQPSAITGEAVGAAGAPTGTSFTSLGNGGTFGMFDRMRNQRQPKTGLSVTPEMLRAAAAARMGSG